MAHTAAFVNINVLMSCSVCNRDNNKQHVLLFFNNAAVLRSGGGARGHAVPLAFEGGFIVGIQRRFRTLRGRRFSRPHCLVLFPFAQVIPCRWRFTQKQQRVRKAVRERQTPPSTRGNLPRDGPPE